MRSTFHSGTFIGVGYTPERWFVKHIYRAEMWAYFRILPSADPSRTKNTIISSNDIAAASLSRNTFHLKFFEELKAWLVVNQIADVHPSSKMLSKST